MVWTSDVFLYAITVCIVYIQKWAVVCALLLWSPSTAGGEDTHDMRPYIEMTWPPPGHALIKNEEIMYA